MCLLAEKSNESHCQPLQKSVFGDDIEVAYNPPADGNCQFHCIANDLRNAVYGECDIRTHSEVRRDIVAFLTDTEDRPNADVTGASGMIQPSQFISSQWSTYLRRMVHPGEFGDHITLWAAARKYNLQIAIISSLGDSYNVSIDISDTHTTSEAEECSARSASKKTILLGHFGEDNGAHYVCLKPSGHNTLNNILSTRFATTRPSNAGNEQIHDKATSISHLDVLHDDDLLPQEVTEIGIEQCASQTAVDNDSDAIPNCWSHSQYMYFKTANPWLTVANGRLGCSACKNIKGLGVKATQGVQLSVEWMECRVSHHGLTVIAQKDSLRKKIHAHKISKAHMQAIEVHVDQKLDKMASSVANQQKNLYDTTCRVFRTVYKQIKLNRPFSDFETEIELQRLNDVNMGRILHTNVSCANIATHIGSQMRKQVALKILNGKRKFAILIDESTTISKLSTLIIYIRTSFAESEPVTIFLDLVELSITTAPAIVSALLECLAGHGLPKSVIAEYCVGLACDGASVMLGKKAGVGKLIRDMFPKIFVWHCVAHRLELSVHDTMKEVAGVNNFKIFIDKLYAVYSMSPKNKFELRQCAAQIDVQLLSIGKMLDTRWVASSVRTVRAVWQSFAALHKHFVCASQDTFRDSKERAVYSGLAQRLSCRNFISNLAVMFDALQELAELSLELQKRDVTLPAAHRAVSRQMLVFEAMCNEPGPHLKLVNASIVQNNNFAGVELHAGQKSDVPIRPAQFFRSLVNSLKNRMLTVQSSHVSTVGKTNTSPAEYDEIVTWSKMLDPETWPEFPALSGESAASSLFGESEVQSMSERLNVDGRQSIRGFRLFKENGGKRVPPELRPLLLALSTIPVCTAECERGFSQMNLIISPTRNSLLVKTTSCLLFGKLVGPPLARFDPLPYVKSWIAAGRHSADDVNSLACAASNEYDAAYETIWGFL